MGLDDFIDAPLTCSFCIKDLTGLTQIHCGECAAVLCVRCFQLGAEQEPHTRGHNYEIKCDGDDGDSLFSKFWTREVEQKLIMNTHSYKLGNWEEITEIITNGGRKRTPAQVKKHFRTYFCLSTLGQTAMRQKEWVERRAQFGSDLQKVRSDPCGSELYYHAVIEALRATKDLPDVKDGDIVEQIDEIVRQHFDRQQRTERKRKCSDVGEALSSRSPSITPKTPKKKEEPPKDPFPFGESDEEAWWEEVIKQPREKKEIDRYYAEQDVCTEEKCMAEVAGEKDCDIAAVIKMMAEAGLEDDAGKLGEELKALRTADIGLDEKEEEELREGKQTPSLFRRQPEVKRNKFAPTELDEFPDLSIDTKETVYVEAVVDDEEKMDEIEGREAFAARLVQKDTNPQVIPLSSSSNDGETEEDEENQTATESESDGPVAVFNYELYEQRMREAGYETDEMYEEWDEEKKEKIASTLTKLMEKGKLCVPETDDDEEKEEEEGQDEYLEEDEEDQTQVSKRGGRPKKAAVPFEDEEEEDETEDEESQESSQDESSEDDVSVDESASASDSFVSDYECEADQLDSLYGAPANGKKKNEKMREKKKASRTIKFYELGSDGEYHTMDEDDAAQLVLMNLGGARRRGRKNRTIKDTGRELREKVDVYFDVDNVAQRYIAKFPVPPMSARLESEVALFAQSEWNEMATQFKSTSPSKVTVNDAHDVSTTSKNLNVIVSDEEDLDRTPEARFDADATPPLRLDETKALNIPAFSSYAAPWQKFIMEKLLEIGFHEEAEPSDSDSITEEEAVELLKELGLKYSRRSGEGHGLGDDEDDSEDVEDEKEEPLKQKMKTPPIPKELFGRVVAAARAERGEGKEIKQEPDEEDEKEVSTAAKAPAKEVVKEEEPGDEYLSESDSSRAKEKEEEQVEGEDEYEEDEDEKKDNEKDKDKEDNDDAFHPSDCQCRNCKWQRGERLEEEEMEESGQHHAVEDEETAAICARRGSGCGCLKCLRIKKKEKEELDDKEAQLWRRIKKAGITMAEVKKELKENFCDSDEYSTSSEDNEDDEDEEPEMVIMKGAKINGTWRPVQSPSGISPSAAASINASPTKGNNDEMKPSTTPKTSKATPSSRRSSTSKSSKLSRKISFAQGFEKVAEEAESSQDSQATPCKRIKTEDSREDEDEDQPSTSTSAATTTTDKKEEVIHQKMPVLIIKKVQSDGKTDLKVETRPRKTSQEGKKKKKDTKKGKKKVDEEDEEEDEEKEEEEEDEKPKPPKKKKRKYASDLEQLIKDQEIRKWEEEQSTKLKERASKEVGTSRERNTLSGTTVYVSEDETVVDPRPKRSEKRNTKGSKASTSKIIATPETPVPSSSRRTSLTKIDKTKSASPKKKSCDKSKKGKKRPAEPQPEESEKEESISDEDEDEQEEEDTNGDGKTPQSKRRKKKRIWMSKKERRAMWNKKMENKKAREERKMKKKEEEKEAFDYSIEFFDQSEITYFSNVFRRIAFDYEDHGFRNRVNFKNFIDDIWNMGYNKERDDLEYEYYNDAEQIISHLNITNTAENSHEKSLAHDMENEIKLAKVDRYMRVLQERRAMRNHAADYETIPDFLQLCRRMDLGDRRKVKDIIRKKVLDAGMDGVLSNILEKDELAELKAARQRLLKLRARVEKLQELHNSGVQTLEATNHESIARFYPRIRYGRNDSSKLVHLTERDKILKFDEKIASELEKLCLASSSSSDQPCSSSRMPK